MKSCSVHLIFPPTWSLCCGGPHIALPLLKAALEKNGIPTTVCDLNRELGTSLPDSISAEECVSSAQEGSIEAMNDIYFRVEDRCNELVEPYGQTWNLQRGLKTRNVQVSTIDSLIRNTQLHDLVSQFYANGVVSRIVVQNPSLIGITIAALEQLAPAMLLARMLKVGGYPGHITLGGNVVSRLAPQLSEGGRIFDLVDSIVFFQGEAPLIQLAGSISNRRSLQHVPGLIWRDVTGRVQRNRVEAPPHVDMAPTPDFGGLPVGRYWGVNYLPLLAARGCYHGRCSFCAIPYGYGPFGSSGIRNEGLVLGDMRSLAERWSISRFKFVDESFPPHLLRNLSMLLAASSERFEWEAYVRLERHWTNQSFVRLLAKAGFKKAYFGLELSSPKARGRLQKQDSAHKIEVILNMAHDEGIKVHLFCLVGYPGTTVDDAKRTLDFLLRHQDFIDTVDINGFEYALHTKVPSVRIVENAACQMQLAHKYEPAEDRVMTMSEVEILAREIEDVIWDAFPRWLHPIYRLATPWVDVEAKGLQSPNASVVA